MNNATILYYSDNCVPPKVQEACLDQLKEAAGDLEIVAVTWKPVRVDNNIVVGPSKRSLSTIYGQILLGLSTIGTEWVFLAEHDILYPEGYFTVDGLTPGFLNYGTNRQFLTQGGYLRACKCPTLSMVAASREVLCESVLHRKKAAERGEKITRAEIGLENDSPFKVVTRVNQPCILDVRHGMNFTGSRGPAPGNRDEELPYWGRASLWLDKLNLAPKEVVTCQ